VLGYDDIDLMETKFVALPTGEDSDPVDGNKTDGEVIYTAINEIKNKLEVMDAKVSYITNVIDNIYKMIKNKKGETSAIHLAELGSSSLTALSLSVISRPPLLARPPPRAMATANADPVSD
jgi:hypothetical protein